MMAKLARFLIMTTFLSAAAVAKQWQDSDLDGVPDLKDACADTPAEVVVDARGCHKSVVNKQSIVVQPNLCLRANNAEHYPRGCTELSSLAVRFEFARAEVLISQHQAIERLARWLNSTNVALRLVGHTDAVGGDRFNRQLSLQRAEQVKKVLVEQFGLHASRFQVAGVGSTEPIANNGTGQGRELNRRVEFLVIVQ
ncbi:OmpA family protein [Shewanella sp. Isolate13]|uniref:OmpA family protein n=1 Tax=Shewanella sp. Isolate13 TaxID=2908531 RepID=UPI001EFE747D|nr:OmpA family protein [Shewanella sp. Isolate13]MCG9730049.1 OmpA family protein [Shewanella sp. Isolate13]